MLQQADLHLLQQSLPLCAVAGLWQPGMHTHCVAALLPILHSSQS